MSALQYLAIAFQLIQNAALLALGVIGYYQVRPWIQRHLPTPILEVGIYGLVFGGFAVLSILASIDAGRGVHLDLRNAMVAVATAFGGVIAGAVAAAVTVLFRVALGGGGVAGGVTAVLVTFAVSAANLAFLRRRAAKIDMRNLVVLGVAVGLTGLVVAAPVGLFPQSASVQRVLREVAPVWAVMLPLTILFLGAIICHFERSQALAQILRDRERELHAILDNAPLAIFFKDRGGRYRLVNRCYEAWYGVTAEQVVGRRDDEIFPPELARVHISTDSDVLQFGRPKQIERGPEHPLPRNKHVLSMKFPIGDRGDVIGLAGFILDITDLKRAENTLRRSEERFRALIENTNDVMGILSPDGHVSYRSPTKAEGLGYGDRFDRPFLDIVHPEDRAAADAALRSVSAAPGAHCTGRWRMRHQDGSWRHIAWSLWNATNVAGVDGIVFNIVDITETQQLEEELLQAQKTEAIGRLAGGIAHDFNNILGAILGFAGFLVEDLPKESPEHDFAERIVKAGERGRDLVQQILSFSRRTDIKRAPQDLGRVVSEARDLLQASVSKSTRFEMHVARDALIADVNLAQISQILMNLVINANDALLGEPGAVRVELVPVRPADPDHDRFGRGANAPALDGSVKLFVGMLDVVQSYARLTVTDTGVGIDPALAKDIFDPFFTTKDRGRGTGLGLAVVHGIVSTYGGAMSVTSRRGEGSTFAVYLPLSATPGQVLPAVPAAAVKPTGRERILVVDDEPDIRDMLAVGLDRLGYEVVAIENPEAAVEAVAEDPSAWDVVISDEVMPQMRGITLFHRLRHLNPRLRFILCTGFSGSTTEEAAREAGIDAYFVKPVSADQLAACIRSLMDAQRQ